MTAIIGRGGSTLEREVDQATRTKKLVLLLGEIEVNLARARFNAECGNDVEQFVKDIKDNANTALAIIRGRA